jgi:hypothetical protein
MTLLLALQSPGPQTYIYAGQVTATSALTGVWSVRWNPAELITATSTVTVTAKVIEKWLGRVAAQSTITAIEKSIERWLGALDAQSAIGGTYSFAPASGAATYTYAGLVACQSTITAAVVGTGQPFGPIPMRRVHVRPRSWIPLRIEAPVVHRYAGQITVPRARLVSTHRVAFSPPAHIRTQRPVMPSVDAVIRQWSRERLITAHAGVQGRESYRDRVAEIRAEDDDVLLELLS